MADVSFFVAVLAHAGKAFKEIKATTDAAFGSSMLQQAQTYQTISLVKARKKVENKEGW